jgi:predicted regulator of Ras-like GTPase activity (Roadblock/LC7/MglB family)
MTFDSEMRALLERCPGAQGAAVIDGDGIPVVVDSAVLDLELLAAEYAPIIRDVRNAARELHHGALKQFTVVAEQVVVVLTSLAAGYFLLVALEPEASTGQARFYSRLSGERLYSEFV